MVTFNTIETRPQPTREKKKYLEKPIEISVAYSTLAEVVNVSQDLTSVRNIPAHVPDGETVQIATRQAVALLKQGHNVSNEDMKRWQTELGSSENRKERNELIEHLKQLPNLGKMLDDKEGWGALDIGHLAKLGQTINPNNNAETIDDEDLQVAHALEAALPK